MARAPGAGTPGASSCEQSEGGNLLRPSRPAAACVDPCGESAALCPADDRPMNENRSAPARQARGTLPSTGASRGRHP